MSDKHKNYVFNLRLDKYDKDKKTYEYLQEQSNKNRTIKKALDYMQTLFGDGDLDEAIDRFNVNVIKSTVLGINNPNPLAITKNTYSSKDSNKSDKENNQHDSKKRKSNTKTTDEENQPKKKLKTSKHRKDVSSDTSSKNVEEEKASENEVRAMLWNGDPTTL